MASSIFNKLKKLNHRHYIYISIIIFLITLIIINFNDLALRFYYTFKTLFNNLYYYFEVVTNSEVNEPKQIFEVLLEHHNNNFVEILPFDYDTFLNKLKTFFQLFINNEWLEFQFLYILSDLINFLQIAMIVLMFIPFLLIIWKAYASETKNKTANQVSKPLSFYLKVKDYVFRPICRYIKSLFTFLKNSKYYKQIIIALLVIITKLCFIALDFVGFYYYFISSLNLKSLYYELLIILIDLYPILAFIPPIGYVIIIYLIFDAIRVKKAYKKLKHYENYNKGFINNLGVISLIVGPPGSKKTLTMSDMTLSAEEIFRSKALKIIKKYDLLFPHFPFATLEREINRAINFHQIYNRFTVKTFIRKKYKRFQKNKCPAKLFGYDYQKEVITVYDGLVPISLKKMLETYGQAYYMYVMSCPLSISNFSIRYDAKKEDKGYFPMWEYEYFKIDNSNIYEKSSYSKILDYDSLRLGKKIINNNPNQSVIDGGVLTLSEFAKERGNQFDHQELKKNSDETNQKNDLVNLWFKMLRHAGTVDNTCFIKVFMDDQRANSLNADCRELSEYTLKLHTTEDIFKTTLSFYWLEPLILQTLVDIRNKLYYQFRHVRHDNTLFIYLINSIANKANLYLIRRFNTFSYRINDISVLSGEELIREQKYYLSTKKIYSDRYATDCYKDFFDTQFEASNIGFIDLRSYASYIASMEELNMQHSYFINDLSKYV